MLSNTAVYGCTVTVPLLADMLTVAHLSGTKKCCELRHLAGQLTRLAEQLRQRWRFLHLVKNAATPQQLGEFGLSDCCQLLVADAVLACFGSSDYFRQRMTVSSKAWHNHAKVVEQHCLAAIAMTGPAPDACGLCCMTCADADRQGCPSSAWLGAYVFEMSPCCSPAELMMTCQSPIDEQPWQVQHEMLSLRRVQNSAAEFLA